MVEAVSIAEDLPAAGGVSTVFNFRHTVFRAPDVSFMLGVDGTPLMALRLDELMVSMTIRSLYGEFIREGDADDLMLRKVIAGLKFVKVIRPGDSVPREILDGTASWAVEERHREIAKSRLTIDILSWLKGQEIVVSDRDALLEMAGDAHVKARVNEAFGELAVKLDLGEDQRQEVVDRIERAARELSYIEALRERSAVLPALYDKVQAFARVYRRERTAYEEIQRILTLMRRPIQEIAEIFDHIDAQCGEIVPLLRNLRNQISFIRECRDDLHQRLMRWDEMVARWRMVEPVRSQENEQELKGLYRFIAQHFIIKKDWQLSGSAYRKRDDEI